jgi:TonB family protein
MARTVPIRVAVDRDPQVTRMVGVSALLHATLLLVLVFVVPLVSFRPAPMVAYTVELTDSTSLGGRLAPGRTELPPGPRPGAAPSVEAPAKQGEPAKAEPAPTPEPAAKSEPAPPPAPEPVVKAEPPPPPKPVEPPKAPEPPKPQEPVAKLPSIEKPLPPKPEAKKPPEPKPEAKPVEPPKPEPKAAAKPEPTLPPKAPEPKPAEPTKAADATAKAAPPKAEAKPSDEAKPVGKPTGKPEGTAGGDTYAAAAEKWRAKGATGGGGGLAGTDTGSGPLGTPGYGGGGGGQVVGFEFLAYQQRVVTTVKGVWTNAAPRPGLVAKVRFQIAANGAVSDVRLEHASGDGIFDSSAVRAVERANPLPPPPARYISEFREFVIEFHSEEGGQGPG